MNPSLLFCPPFGAMIFAAGWFASAGWRKNHSRYGRSTLKSGQCPGTEFEHRDYFHAARRSILLKILAAVQSPRNRQDDGGQSSAAFPAWKTGASSAKASPFNDSKIPLLGVGSTTTSADVGALETTFGTQSPASATIRGQDVAELAGGGVESMAGVAPAHGDTGPQTSAAAVGNPSAREPEGG